MARVQREIGDASDRRTWFVAALCLGWPDGHTATFVGRVDGTATWPPRGTHGFGYDPMFTPVGSARTFGEIEPAEKHRVSHRARAFAQFLRSCLTPAAGS
jgi:non-canonical purine NTP pyrophosphatase (RdgB/HAM1 family)